MRVTTLQFPSLIELVDFQVAASIEKYFINYGAVTLTGYFMEADIELAKTGFEALELAYK